MKVIHHIGVFSHDPEKLTGFYLEKLGFEHVSQKKVGKELMAGVFGVAAPCDLTKLRLGNVVLEVFSSEETDFQSLQNHNVGLNHWGLGVEDKEDYVRKLEKKGVPLIKFEGQGKWIYFIKDPDGNLIEIYEDKAIS